MWPCCHCHAEFAAFRARGNGPETAQKRPRNGWEGRWSGERFLARAKRRWAYWCVRMHVWMYVCLCVCICSRAVERVCSRLANCLFVCLCSSSLCLALCSAQPGCSPLTRVSGARIHPTAQRLPSFFFFASRPSIRHSDRRRSFAAPVPQSDEKKKSSDCFSRHSALLAAAEWERLHPKGRTKGERDTWVRTKSAESPRSSRSVPTRHLP